MKKIISLLVFLFMVCIPIVVNADSTLKMSVVCDKNTLNAGEEAICTVSGSSDAEGTVSLNKSGVSNVTLNVVTSDYRTLGFVDKYSTSNGWYLSGQFDKNVFSFNLNLANSDVSGTEMFTFKVRANSRTQLLKSTISLQDVNVTMNGTTNQINVENGFEITVNADPNNNGSNETNPNTGDNTLIIVSVAGLMFLLMGYVSYRKFNAR